MCLDYIEWKPKKTTGFGYKCVYEENRKYVTTNQGYPVYRKKWNCDFSMSSLTTDRRPLLLYPSGFHIWTTLKAAKKWNRGILERKIVKVEYRQLVCMGTQSGFNVIVAKQFRVIEEK